MVVVVLIVVTVVFRQHLAFLANADALRAVIRQYGVWAPLVLVILQILQVVLASIPGQVLAVVAGYLFGTWWGHPLQHEWEHHREYHRVLAVSTVRTGIRGEHHKEALASFDAVSDDYGRTTFFLLFLVSGLPDDVLCFVVGLTEIPLRQLVVLAVIGRTPAFFLANVVGDFLNTDRIAAAIALTVVLSILGVLGYLNRDRIVRWLRSEP